MRLLDLDEMDAFSAFSELLGKETQEGKETGQLHTGSRPRVGSKWPAVTIVISVCSMKYFYSKETPKC